MRFLQKKGATFHVATSRQVMISLSCRRQRFHSARDRATNRRFRHFAFHLGQKRILYGVFSYWRFSFTSTSHLRVCTDRIYIALSVSGLWFLLSALDVFTNRVTLIDRKIIFMCMEKYISPTMRVWRQAIRLTCARWIYQYIIAFDGPRKCDYGIRLFRCDGNKQK